MPAPNEPSSPRQWRSGPSFWSTFMLLLLIFLQIMWMTTTFVSASDQENADGIEILPGSLHSQLSADYSVDALPTRPGVRVDLIFDVIKDSEPDADIEARRAAVIAQLAEPVPTVDSFQPTATPTSPPEPTSTPTPTATATFAPSATPTTVPSATPTPSPQPTAVPSVSPDEYIVVAGDNMSKIADMFNIELDALLTANPHLDDPNVLRPGQLINLP